MSFQSSPKATLRDVAKLAGASLATVSRVLGASGYPVSEPLRKRIQQAATELGYVPNMAARALRHDVSKDIGIILPNISNPFYTQILQGVCTSALESGYQPLLCPSMRKVQEEHAFLRSLFERRVAGILLSSVDANADAVNGYAIRGMRFVLLDQRLQGAQCSLIHYDTHKGVRLAMRHFMEKGHTRIALATMPLTRWTRQEMYRGYRESLASADIPLDESLVLVADAEQEINNENADLHTGVLLAKRFVQTASSATAVLCVNDSVAFGMIKGFAQAGIRVPEDVSIIGFDDILFASAMQPGLTTVRYPAFEMGCLAVRILLDNLRDGESGRPLRVQFEPQLIARGTVEYIANR